MSVESALELLQSAAAELEEETEVNNEKKKKKIYILVNYHDCFI